VRNGACDAVSAPNELTTGVLLHRVISLQQELLVEEGHLVEEAARTHCLNRCARRSPFSADAGGAAIEISYYNSAGRLSSRAASLVYSWFIPSDDELQEKNLIRTKWWYR